MTTVDLSCGVFSLISSSASDQLIAHQGSFLILCSVVKLCLCLLLGSSPRARRLMSSSLRTVELLASSSNSPEYSYVAFWSIALRNILPRLLRY